MFSAFSCQFSVKALSAIETQPSGDCGKNGGFFENSQLGLRLARVYASGRRGKPRLYVG
jgi:hypothetical protein